MKTTLNIEGMSCEHCVRAVKQALESVPGVKFAEVDLASKRAVVESDSAPLAALVSAVEDEGYGATEAA